MANEIRINFDNKTIYHSKGITKHEVFLECKLRWIHDAELVNRPMPMVAIRNALQDQIDVSLAKGWVLQEITNKRKSWHQHWMEEADHASEMSTCAAGRQVGAVFIRDNRILTTGFIGVPAGYPHPEVCVRKEHNIHSGKGLEMCGCAHAEANGIANAARVGVSLKGSILYCTTEPCTICMGALANVGVAEVVYRDPYHHEMSAKIASFAGIAVSKFAEEE